MKTFRSRGGPSRIQPRYTEAEFEEISRGALEQVGLLPDKPEPVRIDRFIEKRFPSVLEYAETPTGIMGYTVFGPKGAEKIVVNGSLDNGDPVSVRRLRTTLAHEAGHALLHSHLFCFRGKGKARLEGINQQEPKVLCRDESPRSGGADWWEYQANRLMSAILLPEPLILAAVRPFLKAQDGGGEGIPEGEKGVAERVLGELFDVNPVVIRRRLDVVLRNLTERPGHFL